MSDKLKSNVNSVDVQHDCSQAEVVEQEWGELSDLWQSQTQISLPELTQQANRGRWRMLCWIVFDILSTLGVWVFSLYSLADIEDVWRRVLLIGILVVITVAMIPIFLSRRGTLKADTNSVVELLALRIKRAKAGVFYGWFSKASTIVATVFLLLVITVQSAFPDLFEGIHRELSFMDRLTEKRFFIAMIVFIAGYYWGHWYEQGQKRQLDEAQRLLDDMTAEEP